MKRRNKIIIAALLLVVGLVGLSVFVPIYIHDHKGYNCRLCASIKGEETIHIWGIPVYRKIERTKKTTYTEIYDKYIAEAHKHQWAGGGFGRYVRYLFTGGIHKDGMHAGGYPFYQPRLIREVLSVMELFDNESIDFRREMYHDLIECKGDEYEKVQELIEAIRGDPHNGRKLYEIYRQQKSNNSG
jgi:hypothetical protein